MPRREGKLQFLQVRDGTGIIQCIVFKKAVSPEAFDAAQRLTQESSVIVTGQARADERAPGIPAASRLDVTDLEVVQLVTDEYPITLKEHGIDFLLSNRHLWIRSSRQWPHSGCGLRSSRRSATGWTTTALS